MIGRGDVGVIASLREPAPGERRWLSLKLGDCERCGRTHLIAIDEMTLSENDRGIQVREARPFVPFHAVSKADMDEIRARPPARPG